MSMLFRHSRHAPAQ